MDFLNFAPPTSLLAEEFFHHSQQGTRNPQKSMRKTLDGQEPLQTTLNLQTTVQEPRKPYIPKWRANQQDDASVTSVQTQFQPQQIRLHQPKAPVQRPRRIIHQAPEPERVSVQSEPELYDFHDSIDAAEDYVRDRERLLTKNPTDNFVQLTEQQQQKQQQTQQKLQRPQTQLQKQSQSQLQTEFQMLDDGEGEDELLDLDGFVDPDDEYAEDYDEDYAEDDQDYDDDYDDEYAEDDDLPPETTIPVNYTAPKELPSSKPPPRQPDKIIELSDIPQRRYRKTAEAKKSAAAKAQHEEAMEELEIKSDLQEVVLEPRRLPQDPQDQNDQKDQKEPQELLSLETLEIEPVQVPEPETQSQVPLPVGIKKASDLMKYKVSDLRDFCKRMGLPSTGLRKDLVDRLIESQHS